MSGDNSTNINNLITEMYTLFSSFKQRLENPDYIQLESTLQKLVENQNEVKKDVSELKKTLLNPYDGLIIQNNENNQHRKIMEEWLKNEYAKLVEEHKELQRWKTAVTRIGIGIFTASGGVISFLLTKYFGI